MSDYREYHPQAFLKPFVRVVWTYTSAGPDPEIQKIVPDGCAELIIQRAAPYEERQPDGQWRIQPLVLFAGQLTRPLHLRATGPVDVLAVRFEPDGARDFLGFDLSEVTDRRIDLSDRRLPDEYDALQAWLKTHARTEAWAIDPVVRAEVLRLADAAPSDRSGSEQRALQRLFLKRVGVSRRVLRSVFRFRSVFEQALRRDGSVIGWLNAGLDAGYFDQPHLARDFNRFVGCSATEWARQELALARRLASAPNPDY